MPRAARIRAPARNQPYTRGRGRPDQRFDESVIPIESDDSDQTDSDLESQNPNDTRAFVVDDSDDDLTDLESTEDTAESQEDEDEQPEAPQAALNRSDAHVYEEEYSPVEEVEQMPRPIAQAPPPTVAAPAANLDETLSDEKNACVICCEQLTSDGAHEICVLTPCGHIFGRSCITSWVKNNKAECPNCKAKCKTKDIRKIYPATLPLAVADNSEVIQLRKSKDELSGKLVVAEETVVKQASRIEQLQKELTKRQNELQHLRNNRTMNSQTHGALDITLDVTAGGDVDFEFVGRERINDAHSTYLSKALAVDVNQQAMAVCAEEPRNFKNTSLTGALKFGIYQMDLINCRKGRYIPIHKQFIRAMDFGCGFLLTGANDKTIRCVDYQNAKTLNVFQCRVPVWSVAWNRSKSLAYGGLGNGDIVEFDIRIKSKDPTRTLKSGGTQPIHSLQFKNNGLLTGQYKAISWTPLDNKSVVNVLKGQTDQLGPCVAVHESQNTIVTTFRGIENSEPKTIVAKLQFGHDGQNRTVEARTISQFIVSEKHQAMTRDKVLTVNGAPIVACSNQSGNTVKLFTPQGSLVQTLKQTDKTTIDMVQYQRGDQKMLAELDGKCVNFYRLKL